MEIRNSRMHADCTVTCLEGCVTAKTEARHRARKRRESEEEEDMSQKIQAEVRCVSCEEDVMGPTPRV
jgi:hypothetical protein